MLNSSWNSLKWLWNFMVEMQCHLINLVTFCDSRIHFVFAQLSTKQADLANSPLTVRLIHMVQKYASIYIAQGNRQGEVKHSKFTHCQSDYFETWQVARLWYLNIQIMRDFESDSSVLSFFYHASFKLIVLLLYWNRCIRGPYNDPFLLLLFFFFQNFDLLN